MNSKGKHTKKWNKKPKSSLRERRRLKQKRESERQFGGSRDYLNQHLDIYSFKKICCDKKNFHNHFKCFNFHGDEDFIRDPEDFDYSPELCPLNCRNPFCKYSHNSYEKHFHPLTYKKMFCKHMFKAKKDGKIILKKNFECPQGEFCPFAHNQEEIKTELLYNLDIDDDFLMFKFKMEPCPFVCVEHDKKKCLYGHDSKDFRRNIIFFPYHMSICSCFALEDIEKFVFILESLIELKSCFSEEEIIIFKNNIEKLNDKDFFKECGKDLNCKECHNLNEFLYHPKIFKSLKCAKASSIRKTSDRILKLIDTNFDIMNESFTEEDDSFSNSNSWECTDSHCPFSHESENYESIQEHTEPPFYKYPYNRISPGCFFPGNSFFSSKSDNLIYLEERNISLGQYSNSYMNHQSPFMYNQNFYPFQAMDAQRLYFGQDKGPCFMNPYGRGMPMSSGMSNFSAMQNKENMNLSNNNNSHNVNMNMYKIQMNNTFLLPNQIPPNKSFGMNQSFNSYKSNSKAKGNQRTHQGESPYTNMSYMNQSSKFYRC